MLFVGCSFTWGQGLHYYSNSPTIIEDAPNGYNPGLLTRAHIAYKDKIRYPRIVADHFNTYEIVHPRNGGTNQQIVEYWSRTFGFMPPTEYVRSTAYDYRKAQGNETIRTNPDWFDRISPINPEDISHAVFQITEWSRETFVLSTPRGNVEVPMSQTHIEENSESYLKYLTSREITIGRHNDEIIASSLNNVKSFLQNLENAGVKTYITTWSWNFPEFISKDPWLNERFIKFQYRNNEYTCYERLMNDNPELVLSKDIVNFIVPPQDSHPSLACHQLVAKHIIDRIEKDMN
jgi:hypothetical protein